MFLGSHSTANISCKTLWAQAIIVGMATDDGYQVLGREPGSDHRRIVPLNDSRACQTGLPERITARYDAANKANPQARKFKWYYEALKRVLVDIISHGANPVVLSDFFAMAVARGCPIDQNALFADEKVLATEARFIALCIPTLKNIHGDCREWLAVKLRKPADRIEGSAGWNALMGGVAINK